METLTEKEKLTSVIFDDVIKESLKYLHIYYKKFINLDNYIARIGRIPNTNLMSLFDCCREIKLKGKKELTKEEKEAIKKEKEEKRDRVSKGIVDDEAVEKKG